MFELIINAGPYTITNTWYVDGVATDVGEVTITVTDANGDVVVAPVAVTNVGAGVYSYDLASQATPTILKTVWTRTDTGASLAPIYFEVVGNVLFTEVEARNVTISGQQTPLSDETAYPDADILKVRRRITEQFEDRTGRGWTRRYARARLGGSGRHELGLWGARFGDVDGNQAGGAGARTPTKLISVTVGGVALDVADIFIDGRILRNTTVWPLGSVSNPFNVVAEWEYGPDPVPYEATENGLLMAVANLVPSDISAWAESFSNEDGTTNFTAHGLAYPSKVWEWLKNQTRRPTFA